MISSIDQMGRRVELPGYPKRIISTVPSQTELLADLGLQEEVIGITKFCIHPDEWFRKKTRVGGTKNLNLATIEDLHPDLIIANKEENEQMQIRELERRYPVWLSDIKTLDDAIHMIGEVGRLTQREKEGKEIAGTILSSFQNVMAGTPIRAAYVIWKNPLMVAGGDTFISDMLSRAGYVNVFQDSSRYPAVTLQELKEARAEMILLSSEPYPFKEKDRHEMARQLSETQVTIVDGEMFSWYGSRLKYAPDYFTSLRKKIESPL